MGYRVLICCRHNTYGDSSIRFFPSSRKCINRQSLCPVHLDTNFFYLGRTRQAEEDVQITLDIITTFLMCLLTPLKFKTWQSVSFHRKGRFSEAGFSFEQKILGRLQG